MVGHCARGESYLPQSVMTALTLLAVPGSRPYGTHRDSPNPEPNLPDPPDPPDLPVTATVVPREVSDERWTVITNLFAGYTTPELPTVWAAQETDLIEAADRVIAWAHHLQLGATARLREAIGAHCEMQLTPTAFLNGVDYDVETEADAATADEVALVTGLPVHQATARMRLAVSAHGRSRVVISRLHDGRTTLDRALRILDATTDCHPDDVNTIADRVLAELPDGSKPSHQLFTRRLRRQVVLHQPDPTQRHADAVTRRTAFGELLDDGTGVLTVTGDGERIIAALDRIDTIARTLRNAGDPRNLTNLRSDIALDLLLVGWPTPPTTTSTPSTPSTTSTTSTTGPASTTDDSDGRGCGSDCDDRDCNDSNWDNGHQGNHRNDRNDRNDAVPDDAVPDPADLVDLTPWLTLKHAPPAHVNVIVSLTTLLGEDDATAEIPGHGFITAVHARQLAMATGSIWRRLVTDPLTGTTLDLSTQRYRPTRTMADLVAALDGTCRAPGCTIPAPQCDIDHHTPWPHGPTTIANLSAKHRRHHNHKTRRTWITTPDPNTTDGTMTWHTIGARDYITTRYRYTDPTHQPATDAEHTRICATDPPPF